MSYKTRSSYRTGICIGNCKNRDIKCDVCYRKKYYEEDNDHEILGEDEDELLKGNIC